MGFLMRFLFARIFRSSRRSLVLVRSSVTLGCPLDDTLPDIGGAVAAFDYEPVFVVECDIGAADEFQFGSFFQFYDFWKNRSRSFTQRDSVCHHF